MSKDHGKHESLRAKYVQMLAMRVEHAAGFEERAEEVRIRMMELATAYPGALREIDDLELDEIRRRISALDDVLERRRETEPWMEAMALFHALARGALVAKRWLGGRKTVDAGTRRRFLAASDGLPFPEEARGWADHLARVASPPGRRLTRAVFSRVGEELGMTERAARALVFGSPRRERARI